MKSSSGANTVAGCWPTPEAHIPSGSDRVRVGRLWPRRFGAHLLTSMRLKRNSRKQALLSIRRRLRRRITTPDWLAFVMVPACARKRPQQAEKHTGRVLLWVISSNATTLLVSSVGFRTLRLDGSLQPVVSTLNSLDGFLASNMAIVPASMQGQIDAYAANGLTPTAARRLQLLRAVRAVVSSQYSAKRSTLSPKSGDKGGAPGWGVPARIVRKVCSSEKY